jgi:enamine deaminase RidA (YjgF/YER057c/UK114 family)
MTPEERLAQLGITLPEPPPAIAAYVPWIRTGHLLMTSGQLPMRDGRVAYCGKLGVELSEEEGYQAARLSAINALAQLKAAAGELSEIHQIVRVEGYVQSGPGFTRQPQVVNGASELLNELFGDRGRHTRLAIGVNELPLDAAIELAVWAEISD